MFKSKNNSLTCQKCENGFLPLQLPKNFNIFSNEEFSTENANLCFSSQYSDPLCETYIKREGLF